MSRVRQGYLFYKEFERSSCGACNVDTCGKTADRQTPGGPRYEGSLHVEEADFLTRSDDVAAIDSKSIAGGCNNRSYARCFVQRQVVVHVRENFLVFYILFEGYNELVVAVVSNHRVDVGKIAVSFIGLYIEERLSLWIFGSDGLKNEKFFLQRFVVAVAALDQHHIFAV